jgi:hypothetical protein
MVLLHGAHEHVTAGAHEHVTAGTHEHVTAGTHEHVTAGTHEHVTAGAATFALIRTCSLGACCTTLIHVLVRDMLPGTMMLMRT